MLVLEKEEAYFNFVSSINSDATRRNYEYCMSRFLKYCDLDLDSLLKLPQQELSSLIIKYMVSHEKKISSQYKTVIMATIKHACEMNDVILNWKKLKKFIRWEKTDNETNGKDRGYTHEEIQKILDYSDQRLKTAFLVLASTGIRVGALQSIRIGDLEKIDNLYKIIVYSGDKEEYLTFCTPECAKEIDIYLEFRTRRGEIITQDSYLLVRKFSSVTKVKGKPFKGRALWAILEDCISNSGLRTVDHFNAFKRKQIPIFHGFRKFFTKQLVDSNINPEIREMLLGHKIGLASCYYKPTEQEMLNEYGKAVPLLTISNEERLQSKLDEHVQIQKTVVQNIQSTLGVSNQTKIVSAKKKRKNYDSFGNLIPDDDVITIKESQGQDFERLVYYKEDKVDDDER